jgi:hypothetical protein
MLDISNLGYFYSDNVITNNLIIKIILKRVRPDLLYSERRRVKCLDYIINLAAKAFLFNNNSASFDAEISDITNPIILEA